MIIFNKCILQCTSTDIPKYAYIFRKLNLNFKISTYMNKIEILPGMLKNKFFAPILIDSFIGTLNSLYMD